MPANHGVRRVLGEIGNNAREGSREAVKRRDKRVNAIASVSVSAKRGWGPWMGACKTSDGITEPQTDDKGINNRRTGRRTNGHSHGNGSRRG